MGSGGEGGEREEVEKQRETEIEIRDGEIQRGTKRNKQIEQSRSSKRKRHRDTKTPRPGDTDHQGHRGTGTQRDRDAVTQRNREMGANRLLRGRFGSISASTLPLVALSVATESPTAATQSSTAATPLHFPPSACVQLFQIRLPVQHNA